MVNELISRERTFDSENGTYSIIIKVLEYKKIDVLARFNTVMFACTDHIKTQITVVDEASIKDEKYLDLYSSKQKGNVYIDPDNVESDLLKDVSNMAETYLGIPESHVFQGTVETNHKSPKWIEDTEFILSHAKEVAKFILGK